ncbi:MAG: hypothetical protein LBH75_08985 [Treponema sp.]|jgi:hypothetical protein|nr:hypothetical protein [Treponema sp.]
MIDRYKLVTRHNPHYTKEEKQAPLSVGNGRFCFTVDFTGLQTFSASFNNDATGFPLCTMAEWAWHRYANVPLTTAGLKLTPFDTFGRAVGYAVDDTGQRELFYGLRRNAHKFHMGFLSFTLKGKPLIREQCEPIQQTLDMWTGTLVSEFTMSGEPVRVETFVHPHEDSVFVKSTSPLVKKRSLGISLEFPYASHRKSGTDLESRQPHTTSVKQHERSRIEIHRIMDETEYYVTARFDTDVFVQTEWETHRVLFGCGGQYEETLVLAVNFGLESRVPAPFANAEAVRDMFWREYWTSGGAIAFPDTVDPRAIELERRIVLSQYVTAIQCRGEVPPAETGLSCNSWYGKFHLEMLFWHVAHFTLWGRIEEVKKMLAYCKKILPSARRIATSQGYAGARLPKMCDLSGENTPSSVAVLLLWQQPHPIMLAELCYRADPSLDFLHEYRELVVETAEFMRDFLHYDENREEYILGPPYIPAQECHDPRTVLNAPYELEYFRWALMKADEWLERMGERPRFRACVERMANPAHKDGVYLAHENCPDTFSQAPFYTDHPSMLAMFGVLNSERVDKTLMSATLDRVLEVWDMGTLYGWDFPMMAMTMCRLGRNSDAVDLLLMDSLKNTYLSNGHNRQEGDAALPLYLPGNGGLLLATAVLAAGFDGNEGCRFPKSFNAEVENIYAYI